MSDDTKTKLTGRGGPGRGQGRKATSPSGLARSRFELKIDPVALQWLRDHEKPVCELIEKAVIEYYGIEIKKGDKISPPR